MNDNQVHSTTVDTSALFSTFTLDQATVAYFIALHDIHLLLVELQILVVEQYVRQHSALSASENAYSSWFLRESRVDKAMIGHITKGI